MHELLFNSIDPDVYFDDVDYYGGCHCRSPSNLSDDLFLLFVDPDLLRADDFCDDVCVGWLGGSYGEFALFLCDLLANGFHDSGCAQRVVNFIYATWCVQRVERVFILRVGCAGVVCLSAGVE